MSTNYRKGYDREMRVKKKLEQQGYFVVRSAGSHSPVDLVAFREFLHGQTTQDAAYRFVPGADLDRVDILFCQCKGARGMTRRQKQELVELAQRYGARAVLAGPRGQFEYLEAA